MTDLERAIGAIGGHLRSLDVRWAVVGGLAVSARAEARLTRDADVVVSVESDAAGTPIVQLLGAQQAALA